MEWPTAFVLVSGMLCCGLPLGIPVLLILIGLFSDWMDRKG